MKPPRNTKKSNPSTDPEKPAKLTRTYKWREKMEAEGNYGNQHHIPKEKILAYGQAFVDWAKEELDNPYSRRLSFSKFWLINDVDYNTPRTWCETYPEFKEKWIQAMRLIGTKREDGMMMRELDRQATAWNQHHYLDYHKESDGYHAKLKETIDDSKTKAVYKLVEMSDV